MQVEKTEKLGRRSDKKLGFKRLFLDEVRCETGDRKNLHDGSQIG